MFEPSFANFARMGRGYERPHQAIDLLLPCVMVICAIPSPSLQYWIPHLDSLLNATLSFITRLEIKKGQRIHYAVFFPSASRRLALLEGFVNPGCMPYLPL